MMMISVPEQVPAGGQEGRSCVSLGACRPEALALDLETAVPCFWQPDTPRKASYVTVTSERFWRFASAGH